MALADEYFFIAHDVQTGKLRLQTRAAGLGAAAALLGELVLGGHIDVVSRTVRVVDKHPPDDDLNYQILRQISSDRQNRSLRTWLSYLGQGAVERVSVRLTRAGQIEANKSRRPWGTAVVRYVPTDVHKAVWPADRLNLLISRGEALEFHDAMLAGLVAVTGLTKHVWWDGDAVTMRNVAAAVASLPISLREILGQTESAVAEATLAPHG